MKTLCGVLLLTLYSISAYAVCPVEKTTVFYINGIGVSEPDAEKSRVRLEQALLSNPAVTTNCVTIKLAYSYSTQLMVDLLEAGIQKAQETGRTITGFVRSFLRLDDARWIDEILAVAADASSLATYVIEGQVAEHLAKYQVEGQTSGRLILVGHSQGNLYSNEEWDRLSLESKPRVHLVAVATPAVSVADGGPYVTLEQDLWASGIFILFGAPLPNVSNTEGFCLGDTALDRWYCHGFKESYLHGTNSRTKIVNDDIVALLPQGTALTFTDDFNRPNSATVGNGWSNTTGNIGGNLAIKNNELTCPSTGGAGIFRPFPFTAPITTTARVKEQNGFGTLLRRYVTSFLVRNNGTLNQGYGVVVVRSDQNFNNSQVILVEDNTQLASIPSTFQYGPEIHVSVTFNLDGSVTGTVSAPPPSTATFSFSFPPHQIQSVGDNFSIAVECSSGPVNQRIDDVAISE